MGQVQLKTARAWGRGSVFPHSWAWMLDLPGRDLILSARALAGRLPLEPDSRVLEIGPGSGRYSEAVAARLTRGHLQLFDLQAEMLEKARRRLAGAGNVSYRQGDAGELPFADGEFDVAYLVTVFGEIERQDRFLAGVRRVLRPGGVLSVSEHHPDPDFEHADAVIAKVEPAGFVCVQRLGWRYSFTLNFRSVSA